MKVCLIFKIQNPNKIIIYYSLNKAMYNRFIHQQQQSKLKNQLRKSQSFDKVGLERRRSSNKEMSQKYKERVRNFLVEIVTKPIVLGEYQPPITNIMRNPQNEKIRANAQLYINGFKTNRQRIANKIQENKIYDLSPPKKTALLHQFRPRDTGSQIQPGMRFQGRSYSMKQLSRQDSLPKIRMRFKGLQQLGNNLKSMKQNQPERNGLINRLQTVSGGKQYDHLTFSMLALRESKFLTNKYQPIK